MGGRSVWRRGRCPAVLRSLFLSCSLWVVVTRGEPCNPALLAGCADNLIPYSLFTEAFPVIEYCVSPDHGFIAVSKQHCEAWGFGSWTIRPDFHNKSESLEDQYACVVCTERNTSISQGYQGIWLLSAGNATSFSSKDMDAWEKVVGSRIDQIVVADETRYVFALSTYQKIQDLLRAFPRTFFSAQPMPPELKVSPRVVEAALNQTSSSSSSSTEAVTLRVTTLSASGLAGTAASKSRKFLNMRSSGDPLGGGRGSSEAWCVGLNCTVTQQEDGNYVVDNVETTTSLDLATNISATLHSVFVIDIQTTWKLFNKEATYLTQSGHNHTKGGTRALWTGGLSGDGVVIGVADTGLDYQSCFFYDSSNTVTFSSKYDSTLGDNFNVYSSTSHRKIREYFGYVDSKEGTNGGHGTHVSGSLAGYPANLASTSLAYSYSGNAYKAKLAFFDVGDSSDTTNLWVPADLSTGMFPRAYAVGARLHSDSWGSSVNSNGNEMYQTDYYLWNNQDFLIFYAAGNDGYYSSTVGLPATAKNSVAVGATENWEDNPDIAWFSSRGPTFDARFKPDVCAPGDPVFSAYSWTSSSANQCYIVGMSGTSMATPTAASVGALLYEYFTKGYYPLGYANANNAMQPMGALIKAMLVNSAERMYGTEATRHNSLIKNISFPNWDQGFGRINAKNVVYFEGKSSSHVLYVDGQWSSDCASCPQFSASTSRQRKRYHVTPTASSPIKITLAWHDYPAAYTITSYTLINDLDLYATQGSKMYYANGQNWTSGVNAINNVEQVIIPSPKVGQTITVTVDAWRITSGPQPYALVITGKFRKDYRLFDNYIPKVTTVATDGAQALIVGANLPVASTSNQTFNWTCTQPKNLSLSATIVEYSSDGSYLSATLSTTQCKSYKLRIMSDGFIGNYTKLSYGTTNISAYCVSIAYDKTCWTLDACAGSCVATTAATTPVTQEVSWLSKAVLGVGAALLMAVIVGVVLGVRRCARARAQSQVSNGTSSRTPPRAALRSPQGPSRTPPPHAAPHYQPPPELVIPQVPQYYTAYAPQPAYAIPQHLSPQQQQQQQAQYYTYAQPDSPYAPAQQLPVYSPQQQPQLMMHPGSPVYYPQSQGPGQVQKQHQAWQGAPLMPTDGQVAMTHTGGRMTVSPLHRSTQGAAGHVSPAAEYPWPPPRSPGTGWQQQQQQQPLQQYDQSPKRGENRRFV